MDAPTRVNRPVWRTYLPRYLANAVLHVRAGGHAVIRCEPRWRLLLPCTPDGAIGELTAWALMDLGIGSMAIPTEGPAAGLVEARLPARLRETVADWCERDATCPDAVTAVALDCRACAQCCRHNRVVLEAPDMARWEAAGRGDLAAAPYVRPGRGTSALRVLRVLRGGDCVHLVGNDCGIYALRPDNCRAFPAGSEPCLSARREAGMELSPPG